MNPEQKWVNHIKKYCNSWNKQLDHIEADKALKLFLISLGYTEIVKAFESVDKSY
jgi:hypothetical protein